MILSSLGFSDVESLAMSLMSPAVGAHLPCLQKHIQLMSALLRQVPPQFSERFFPQIIIPLPFIISSRVAGNLRPSLGNRLTENNATAGLFSACLSLIAGQARPRMMKDPFVMLSGPVESKACDVA